MATNNNKFDLHDEKSPFPEKKEEDEKGKGDQKKTTTTFLADDLQEMGSGLSSAEPEESNTWVITYADLMTLLMTFFVLLFSVSQIDVEKFQNIAQSLAAALGSGKEIIFVKESAAPDDSLRKKQTNTAYYAEMLREELQEEVDEGVLEIDHKGQIITIQILQNGSFQKGKAVLNRGFFKSLIKIQKALVNLPGTLTVAGHTDNIPIETARFRSNWELSAARAYTVMHELLKNDILPDERFLLMGHAETKSRVPNDSEANRAKNRRVEIIIDQRDQQLSASKSSSNDINILQSNLNQEIDQGSIFIDNQ